ncbi:MAG: CvpA family protein [Clostridia bacterium]|nr:CvpA family protein [Clostridia bacterium]
MKKGMIILKALIATVIFGALYFYAVFPPINLQDEGFYFFLVVLVIVFFIAYVIFSFGRRRAADVIFDRSTYKTMSVVKPLGVIIAVIVVVFIIGTIVSVPIFRAASYRDLIKVETGSFTDDVAEITYNQIPLLDKASAQKLGDRKLGELADMVSQFEVSGEYSQINFRNRPYRVTSLYYGDVWKWINNTKKGLPAYMRLDMITQEVEVVRLEDEFGACMKVSPYEHFNELLERFLRFRYPTYIFADTTFEIDDAGRPYWIAPHIKKTIGLFGGRDVVGIVLVDAITAECKYYTVDEIPQWIDGVFPAPLIVEQYNYHGLYIKGFINSIFGQKDVTQTTAGYNYLALNDDIYVYTGITSSGGDDSNIGFMLCNQRTKEARYYSVPGAAEYSAMRSAEGVVQHLKYEATFPLLLNVAGQPTYFIALKDNAQLVKQYAMVNVERYQIVATGASVAECEKNYIRLLRNHGDDVDVSGGDVNESTGIIAEIRSAVIEGNTYFYIRLEGEGRFYRTSAAADEFVITLNPGDAVIISYVPSDTGIYAIQMIERAQNDIVDESELSGMLTDLDAEEAAANDYPLPDAGAGEPQTVTVVPGGSEDGGSDDWYTFEDDQAG